MSTDKQRASCVVITCGPTSVCLWTRIAKTMIGTIVSVTRTTARMRQRATATRIPTVFPRDAPELHASGAAKSHISEHVKHEFVVLLSDRRPARRASRRGAAEVKVRFGADLPIAVGAIIKEQA